jgi:hypothetical protein
LPWRERNTRQPPEHTQLHQKLRETSAVVQEGAGRGAGRPRKPSGGAMLGRRRFRRGGYLYSRWGLFAGTVCWCCLAGFIFLVWLAPPAGWWRSVPARPAESPPAVSAWAAAAAVPPGGAERSATAEDSASAAAATETTDTTACGGGTPLNIAVDGARAEPDVQREPGMEGKRIDAASAAPTIQTAVLIRHRTGSASGREAAQLIADEARRTGLRVIGIRPVSAVPDQREVQYLRDEDAAEGERLASQFRQRWGSAWKVREKRPGTAPPKALAALPAPAHRLEVWLPHR